MRDGRSASLAYMYPWPMDVDVDVGTWQGRLLVASRQGVFVSLRPCSVARRWVSYWRHRVCVCVFRTLAIVRPGIALSRPAPRLCPDPRVFRDRIRLLTFGHI